jgi:nucleoside-diphosphate-sugar epimerase
VTQALLARGDRVIVVQRKPPARLAPGAEFRAADAMDAAALTSAMEGCSTVVCALGLFVPVLTELSEMRFQWDPPCLVDDSRIRARFGLDPTSIDTGLAATIAGLRVRQ